MDSLINKIKSNDGSMLLLTLITITVIIILGVSALNVAFTESKIAKNELNRQKAIKAAEAGIEEAIADKTNATEFSYTFSDGSSYKANKTTTPSSYDQYIVSTGESLGITKTISTLISTIKDFNNINGAIVGDNVSLNNVTLSKGNLVANSKLSILNNVTYSNNPKIFIGPNAQISGITALTPTPASIPAKIPVLKLDLQYYHDIAQDQGKLQSSGSLDINNYATVNGYKLYFIDGDLTINTPYTGDDTIIIATRNITISSDLGKSSSPIIVYGSNVNLVSSNTASIQGIIMANNTINQGQNVEMYGALIAKNVYVDDSRLIEFNSGVLSSTNNLKFNSNNRSTTWNEK